MSIVTFAPAAACRPPAGQALRRAAARYLAWRATPRLQALDPAELDAVRAIAAAFSAFCRRSKRRARALGASLAHDPRGDVRRAIAALRGQLAKAQVRFCLRATANALLAFALVHMLAIPLHGQWAVPTAVAVIQMSIGGSLKAASEYILGTIGGALYAGAVAALVPHASEFSLACALALAIAPLAYAAAIHPGFRVAPVTAVLVLMLSTRLGEAPLELAYDRLLEVAIGGLVAITVSFLVLPAPAHMLGLGAAARVLEQMAQALPAVIAGFAARVSPMQNLRRQDEIGDAVRALAEMAGDAKSERLGNLAPDPDLAVLARSLLRLRHDLVMLGRAAAAPLPARIATRLCPLLVEIGAGARDYLRASADALVARRAPPSTAWVDDALAAYIAEFAALRAAGLLSALPMAERERLFALGFALQQLQQNLCELAHCLHDWARNPGWRGKAVDLALWLRARAFKLR